MNVINERILSEKLLHKYKFRFIKRKMISKKGKKEKKKQFLESYAYCLSFVLNS